MRRLEGGYCDAFKFQRASRRIDRTQYFSEVNVETQPVEGKPDQVDMSYTVKERPTRALLFTLGFSSVEKLALSASITQSHIFGTVKFLPPNASHSTAITVYSRSYMNTHITGDGISIRLNAYRTTTITS